MALICSSQPMEPTVIQREGLFRLKPYPSWGYPGCCGLTSSLDGGQLKQNEKLASFFPVPRVRNILSQRILGDCIMGLIGQQSEIAPVMTILCFISARPRRH